MGDPALEDLGRLDADVRRAASLLADEASELGTEEGRARVHAADPWSRLRHVAGASTYAALGSLAAAPHEVLHRDALLRWIHELTQARIGRDLFLEDVSREHAARASEPALLRKEGRAALSLDPSTSTPLEQGRSHGDSFASAMSAFLRASDEVRARTALERASSLAAPVAAVRRERRARRAEVARRLGLAHAAALVFPDVAETDPSGAILARAWLDATEPLASSLHRAARRKAGGDLGPEATVQASLARDVVEGWPARLGERWLEDVFRGAVARPVQGLRFDAPLGGASFLRAAYAYGVALREQGTARSLPFALARDPYAISAHRFGALFALALAEPVLHTRALGTSRRVALEQARSLRASLFVASRVLAMRVLFASEPGVSADLFEESTMRVFGGPMPAGLRDAWPRLRIDDRARLAAACSAHGFLADVVDRFDEDWFANPKAGAHLGSIACGPMAEPMLATQEGIARAARAAEGALG